MGSAGDGGTGASWATGGSELPATEPRREGERDAPLLSEVARRPREAALLTGLELRIWSTQLSKRLSLLRG